MFIPKESGVNVRTAVDEMKKLCEASKIDQPLDYEEWILYYVNEQKNQVYYGSYMHLGYSEIRYFLSDNPKISQESFQSIFENTSFQAKEFNSKLLSELPDSEKKAIEECYKTFMPGFPSVFEQVLKEKKIQYDPEAIYEQAQKTLSVLKPLFPVQVSLPLKLSKDIQFDVDSRFDVHGWIDHQTEPWKRLSVKLKYKMNTEYRKQEVFIDCTFIPNERNEEKGCAFIIRIPDMLWQYMDREKMITAFQETCKEMNASFACINCDEPRWRLSECPYVYLHNDGQDKDSSLDRIPGFFWAQWINESIIKNTGSMQWVYENAPYEMKKIHDTANGKCLWMQSSGEVESLTYEKKLLLREFFKDSLYDLDMEKIYNANKFDVQRWRQMSRTEVRHLNEKLKGVPLTKEEIRELKKFSKGK